MSAIYTENFTRSGATPDIYTNGNAINSLEVVKHLIGDDELSLPEDYVRRISWDNQE